MSGRPNIKAIALKATLQAKGAAALNASDEDFPAAMAEYDRAALEYSAAIWFHVQPFRCPRCGTIDPSVSVQTNFLGPDWTWCVPCLERNSLTEIPCPTCYGPKAEDYVTCWTCDRSPDVSPRLTDDPVSAFALQKLVWMHFDAQDAR